MRLERQRELHNVGLLQQQRPGLRWPHQNGNGSGTAVSSVIMSGMKIVFWLLGLIID